jgi:adenylate cyclase
MKPHLFSRLRRIFTGARLIGLILLVDLLVVRWWDPQPVVAMRFQFFDMFQRWLPRTETTYPVVIVDVDEKSLRELGQWPWPRATLASMVNRLRQDAAAAIGFDVVFAEADRSLSIETSRLLALPASDLKTALMDLKTNDAIFADAIRPGQVVLGQIALTEQEREAEPIAIKPTTPGLLGGNPRPYLPSFASLLDSIPVLAEAAAGRGNFNLVGDLDGIIRRVPLAVRVGDVIVPSLGVELLRVATGQKSYFIQMERPVAGTTSGIAAIKVAGVAIPTDRNGMLYIRFGPHDRARFVSAADVIAGRLPPERFRGRLVLVGTSAAGLHDLKSTPLSGSMPGVEIHAQLLENVLAGSYLVRPNYAPGIELTVCFLGGLLLIALVPALGVRWTAALHVVAIVALFGMALYLFAAKSVLVDWTYPTFSGSAIYLLLVYLKYASTEKQRKQVIAAFRQYLSPVMVERVAREPPRLGGETKLMTVMFCDIRDFTGISERLRDDPQALTTLVNRFLTTMSRVVLAEGGTIDKYVGDSLIAFWNAPLAVSDHAARACRAALAMTAELARLNDEAKAEAAKASVGAAAQPLFLAMGVGINTGECVVGNLGSEYRFNYSVLGDSVNLASRLESLSKHYGLRVIVNESVRSLTADFAALELDLVAVVGKVEPARVFGVLGPPEEAQTPEFRRIQVLHGQFLAAYRAQRWNDARAILDECGKLDPRLSKLHRRYRRRMAHYEQEPPDADWDGVFRAQVK